MICRGAADTTISPYVDFDKHADYIEKLMFSLATFLPKRLLIFLNSIAWAVLNDTYLLGIM